MPELEYEIDKRLMRWLSASISIALVALIYAVS